MGFGTGFMALGLYLMGNRILPLSKEHNYITPSDLIYQRYGSIFLKKLFSAVMIVFTLSYLVIQAIASGKALESLVGILYVTGAFLVTAFVVLYAAFGGMRSDMWTDLLQGILMIVCTLDAFVIIAKRSGGFVHTHLSIAESFPLLFSRPGQDGSMEMGVWFGYLVLWFFADPIVEIAILHLLLEKTAFPGLLYSLSCSFLGWISGTGGKHRYCFRDFLSGSGIMWASDVHLRPHSCSFVKAGRTPVKRTNSC